MGFFSKVQPLIETPRDPTERLTNEIWKDFLSGRARKTLLERGTPEQVRKAIGNFLNGNNNGGFNYVDSPSELQGLNNEEIADRVRIALEVITPSTSVSRSTESSAKTGGHGPSAA